MFWLSKDETEPGWQFKESPASRAGFLEEGGDLCLVEQEASRDFREYSSGGPRRGPEKEMPSLGFREGDGSAKKVSTKPQVFFFCVFKILIEGFT